MEGTQPEAEEGVVHRARGVRAGGSGAEKSSARDEPIEKALRPTPARTHDAGALRFPRGRSSSRAPRRAARPPATSRVSPSAPRAMVLARRSARRSRVRPSGPPPASARAVSATRPPPPPPILPAPGPRGAPRSCARATPRPRAATGASSRARTSRARGRTGARRRAGSSPPRRVRGRRIRPRAPGGPPPTQILPALVRPTDHTTPRRRKNPSRYSSGTWAETSGGTRRTRRSRAGPRWTTSSRTPRLPPA